MVYHLCNFGYNGKVQIWQREPNRVYKYYGIYENEICEKHKLDERRSSRICETKSVLLCFQVPVLFVDVEGYIEWISIVDG
jgi:uncharacterized protein (DUF2126 family)